MNQLSEHAIGSALVNLSQTSKLGQFVVCHAHIDLISLNIGLGDGLQFCGRSGVQESVMIEIQRQVSRSELDSSIRFKRGPWSRKKEEN